MNDSLYTYVVRPNPTDEGVWSLLRVNRTGHGWHIRDYISESAAHYVAHVLQETETFGVEHG